METAIYKYLHFAPAQGSIPLCNVLRTRPFKYIVYILCDPINGSYSLEKMKRTQQVPKKGAIFLLLLLIRTAAGQVKQTGSSSNWSGWGRGGVG